MRILNVFKRKSQPTNPADEATKIVTKEWTSAHDRLKRMSDKKIKALLQSSENARTVQFQAARELANRNDVDLFSRQLRLKGLIAEAAVDGLCCSACNGNRQALEMVSSALNHDDVAVRKRLVMDLYYIARGTPGDRGESTSEIRESARAMLLEAQDDSAEDIRRVVGQALSEIRDSRGIIDAPDALKFTACRVCEDLDDAIDAARRAAEQQKPPDKD